MVNFIPSRSLALTTGDCARIWGKSHDIVGGQFYDNLLFDSVAGPIHSPSTHIYSGMRTNCVDQSTAITNNLTYSAGDTFTLCTDSGTMVTSGKSGRKSVRLVSWERFQYPHRHGCGTWPAIEEAGLANWPYEGEVNIPEGMNDVSPNTMTLHTSPGCTIPTGAMERTGSFFKIWFWPRNGNTPDEVRYGNGQISGTPAAFFPNWQYDINGKFGGDNLIINSTLRSNWAGNSFNGGGYPGPCIELVDNNPGAFVDAYFNIGSVRIYQ
ncbi:hypothetical protein BDM02DRAFT_3156811 [Thelephora ganbajun]|uniref:Uncharacterized protein n=1 Tax=Thelephora ganbajun TaxID=370292 RepID=A0ACB6Z8D2_THEGA|nr:hypothetical protein BDM02DRAFT_3156811 [Thelephora ganbajun]